MSTATVDPVKLFMTEFMIVSILTNNITLTEDDICSIIERALSEKLARSKSRIMRSINNLLDRGVIEKTEFGNYCLHSGHRNLLRA